MKSKLLIIILLICAGGINTQAQLRFSTLKEVLDYADRNAISIQSAMHQEKIAESKSRASKAALLPSVNGFAGFNDNIILQPTLVPANLFNPGAPAGTFKEYTFGKKYMYSTGVQASWDIVNFQKWFAIKTTEATQKLNEANTVKARYQAYNQLAQTYYSILLTKKYIKICESNITASDSIYKIAEDKYEAGIFTEENLNRSKIQQMQTEQQVSSLSSSLGQLYNQLQSQLNSTDSLILTDELSAVQPDLEQEEVISTVAPDVQIEQAQLELNRRQLEGARSMQYPTFTIGYQFNRNWAMDKMFDLSNANNLPQHFWNVKLDIPVFNGLSTREKVVQSRIQYRQQQQVLDNKKLTAQKEDDNLKIQFRQSTEDLKKQEEILRLQYRNDNHSKNRYESGIIGLDERLDKFKDLLQEQNQYMQNLSNYYINYYTLYIRKLF